MQRVAFLNFCNDDIAPCEIRLLQQLVLLASERYLGVACKSIEQALHLCLFVFIVLIGIFGFFDHAAGGVSEIGRIRPEGAVWGILFWNWIGLRERGETRRIVAPGKMIELDLIEPGGQRAILDAEFAEREDLLILPLIAVEARHVVIAAGIGLARDAGQAKVPVIPETLERAALFIADHARRAQVIGLNIRPRHRIGGSYLLHDALADQAVVHAIAGDDEGMKPAAIPIAGGGAALSLPACHDTT